MQSKIKVKPFLKIWIKMSFVVIMKSTFLLDPRYRPFDLSLRDNPGCCEYTEQSLRICAWNLINLERKGFCQEIIFIWHLSSEHWDLTDLELACECEKYDFCKCIGKHCFATQWWSIEESNHCTRKTYFLWCMYSLGAELDSCFI